jgi:hypothetical protein
MAMDERLLARISRSVGVPDLVDVLAERLTPTDLQSLLLEVYRRRAAAVTPARLLERYEQNPFVRPADADPQALAGFDRVAGAELPPGYVQLELAPLAPLGTIAALGGLHQDWTVSTIRNTELVSDSTNVLGLECASRRRHERGGENVVRLCASHRLIRGQSVPAGQGLSQHFRVFALCAAGRDTGSLRFEAESMTEQLGFYLRVLTGSRLGLGALRVRVTLVEPDGGGMLARLQERVFEPLAQQFPRVELGQDPDPRSGRGYYVGVRFQIYVGDDVGQEAHVADGGFTRWTQALLSDRRERLLTSGISAERLYRLFGRKASGGAPSPARRSPEET